MLNPTCASASSAAWLALRPAASATPNAATIVWHPIAGPSGTRQTWFGSVDLEIALGVKQALAHLLPGQQPRPFSRLQTARRGRRRRRRCEPGRRRRSVGQGCGLGDRGRPAPSYCDENPQGDIGSIHLTSAG
jgi:hypothetical protein